MDLDRQSADIAEHERSGAEHERSGKDAIEQRAGNARGRRTLFGAAGAMMEMADYAERNGGAETAPAAANLRGDATAIRIATAKDFVRRLMGRRAK